MERAEKINKAAVWRKWAALAACLCLVAVGIFTIAQPEKRGGTLVVFNDVAMAPIGASAMIALASEDFCSMSLEESLAYFGLALPEDGLAAGLNLTGGGCFGSGYGVYRAENRDVYYDVNSYQFTGSGKSVILTLRTCFNFMPSSEQVIKGPEQIEFTEINGWKLALFRYVDDNGEAWVYTEFVLDGVTCTISTCGLANDELAQVLMGILPPKEHVAGSVSVTGAVTYVDSRTEDYFDGTEHHNRERYDYITVDCGDTCLTVWFPGEANRFSAGDSVTITYNGEPATAYNIWPGQLISVK